MRTRTRKLASPAVVTVVAGGGSCSGRGRVVVVVAVVVDVVVKVLVSVLVQCVPGI